MELIQNSTESWQHNPLRKETLSGYLKIGLYQREVWPGKMEVATERRIRGMWISVMILLASSTAFLLTISLYTLTRANIQHISLIGTPIEETEFSSLVNETPHPVVLRGNWSQISERPYRKQLLLSNRNITVRHAREQAESFLPSDLSEHLEFREMVSDDVNESNRLRFFFHNYTDGTTHLLVWVSVNSISGEVMEYEETWRSNETLPVGLKSLYPYSGVRNTTSDQANQIAAEFLASHGYTLEPSSRYIGTTLTVTEEQLLEIMEEGFENPKDSLGPTVYDVALEQPNGLVFPDKRLAGIRILVSAFMGRVVSFHYNLVSLPSINLESIPLINERAARNSAENYAGSWLDTNVMPRESMWEQGHVVLYLLEGEWATQMEFQLAWAFRVSSRVGNIQTNGEIAVDAISGNWYDLHPRIYFESVARTLNPLEMATIVVVASAIVGCAVTMIHRSRYLGSSDNEFCIDCSVDCKWKL